jgi:2-phospho-L-lactate guanylyltransferase (CobY/MobA/RfbA family)
MSILNTVENHEMLDDVIEKLEDVLEGVEMVVAISALANMLVECFGEIGESINADQALNTFASVTEQMQIELEEILDLNISEQSH